MVSFLMCMLALTVKFRNSLPVLGKEVQIVSMRYDNDMVIIVLAGKLS